MVDQVLTYYKAFKTDFEIKAMKRTMDIANFGVSTLINLHMLTCSMILVCHLEVKDFESSWLGSSGVEEADPSGQYIVALYFVTTTLSTCGFGDLCPGSGRKFESFTVLCLQFIGMLFYSTTIDKI